MDKSKKSPREPIAIVGMSCRYPNARSLAEFWELLVAGQDATGHVPFNRWNQQDYPYSIPDTCKSINAGFLSVPVDEFDARFFGISPKEATFIDPQARLLLELVWEGLEDAGIDPHSLSGTNGGIYVGSWLNDYKEILLQCPGYTEFFRRYMGNSIGSAAARISFLLGMTGPSIATESGCSSSMVAVHLACKSLQRGECGVALACGVNLLLKPFDRDEMPMMVSPDGHCKTFDEKANGFARAEGVGVLVLKRLSDAVKDKDRIWGLIKGSAMTQEGLSKSMGTPSVHCEALAMKLALEDAGIRDPACVTYVEAHGTGTKVGDPLEIKAIAEAYSTASREMPLYIGSVKTNVGHTESCSGITGIMKVILAMQHGVLPPHINLHNLNPDIDLNVIPAMIPIEPVKWVAQPKLSRIAGVSSFGITGTDAHVILEEPPSNQSISEDCAFKRPQHLIKFSAKSKDALIKMVVNFGDHCQANEDTFADICFTANTGRATFTYKAAIIADSKEKLVERIESGDIIWSNSDNISLSSKKICFLFTGQGSQYLEMGKQLYDTSPIFQKHFDSCSVLFASRFNIDIKNAYWNKNGDQVNRTIYSQPGIFCVQYALVKLWESWGIKADFVLGHSLGEFAAAVCAEILSLENAVILIAERSRLIEALPEGKMLAIRSDKTTVEEAMHAAGIILDFAAFNSSMQTVVAGDSNAVERLHKYLREERHLKCTILEANHAFHSCHMDPILKEYKKICDSLEIQKGPLKCEFISGLRGTRLDSNEINAAYWVDHARKPVSFITACNTALETCQIFVEIGPHPVLSALTNASDKANSGKIICLPSLRKANDDWTIILNSLARLFVNEITIDWKGFDGGYVRQKVQIPHYPFMGQRFWPEIKCSLENTKILNSHSFANHPLLGSEILNASSVKIFEGQLNAEGDPRIKFMLDHKIGDTPIFPGVAYLEMCVAAMHTAMGTGGFVKVENLSIIAPLALSCSMEQGKFPEPSFPTLQTILEPETCTDKNCIAEYSVKFLKKRNIYQDEWITLAKAVISSFSQSSSAVQKSKIKITEILESGRSQSTRSFYDRMASGGLNFGSSFQLLGEYWEIDGNAGQCKALLAKVKNFDDNCFSTIHPAILDAMLQAIIIFSDKISGRRNNCIFVPVKAASFTWIPRANENFENAVVYIYVSSNTRLNGIISAKFLDSRGTVLASISGVEFVETSIKSLEAVIQEQDNLNEMPDMWEECWIPAKLSSLEYRLNLHAVLNNRLNHDLANASNDVIGMTPPNVTHIDRDLLDLVFHSVVDTLHALGWKPEVGQLYDICTLRADLNVADEHKGYFEFMLELLVERGILEQIDISVYKVKHLLEFSLSSAFFEKLSENFKTVPLFIKVGENLGSILTNQSSPHDILFPQEGNVIGAQQFYDEYAKVFGFHHLAHSLTKEKIHQFRNLMGNERYILRIIEIGAGTGSYTEIILEMLEELNVEYEYTYTDISPAFFPGAEKRFQKYLGKIRFLKLNIEEDPLEQDGVLPQYYDICLAYEVIHATRKIAESLENIRMLLRPGGILELGETTRVDAHYITYLFGLLKGYWKFEDRELRHKRCFMTKEMWRTTLEENGFQVGSIPSCYLGNSSIITCHAKICQPNDFKTCNSKTWVVFENGNRVRFLKEKFQSINRQLISVTPVTANVYDDDEKFSSEHFKIDIMTLESDMKNVLGRILERENTKIEGIIYAWALDSKRHHQDNILQPFFHLTKYLKITRKAASIPIIVLTSGQACFEDCDMSPYMASMIWGYARSIMNEPGAPFDCRCIDINGSSNDEQIFHEIFDKKAAPQVAFKGAIKYSFKLKPCDAKSTDEILALPPNSSRFQLILPESKSLTDLKFGEPLEEAREIGEDEVEIRVSCAALNFRDILSVLKPTEQFRNINSVGIDVCGDVTRLGAKVTRWLIGDFVFGFNMNDSGPPLPSHVIMNENWVTAVPSNMSHCDAATLPAVFSTAFKCLHEIANLQPSDKVLIHTATGGVGLVAVDLCKSVVPMENIFVTAGSARKRAYLRNLGIQNVYNSRDTNYSQEILNDTNGIGVDVVLNSLTSEGFKEATVTACAKGARFVEMSKLSIWTLEEMRSIRPDIKYTVFNIAGAEKEDMKLVMEKLKDFIDRGIVKPLPCVRFDAVRIRQAMHYLHKAKHIGKVVIMMPQLNTKSLNKQRFQIAPLFNRQSTYLITGGLCGIGLEVGKWMLEQDAKNVCLAARNPPTPEVSIEIEQMNKEFGTNVVSVQMDVSSYENCRKVLLQTIPNLGMPPVGGVMHAAGVLADGLIENQTWPRFSSVFQAKIDGTLNLHEVTKHLNLEHFVLFSSFAAALGPPGQSNHAAANQFEDNFAHYRNSIGLTATTINWGNWCEVGVARKIDFPGVRPITNKQGLAALEHILRTNRLQTLVANLEGSNVMKKQFPQLFKYLDDSVLNRLSPPKWEKAGLLPRIENRISTSAISSIEFWEEYNKLEELSKKIEFVRQQVRCVISKVLNLPTNDPSFGNDTAFEAMGVDSLMFVEIKNGLHFILSIDKITMSEALLREYNTSNLLSNQLVEQIERKEMRKCGDELSSSNLRHELISKDCSLPTNLCPVAGTELAPLNNLKIVLLTGSTGTLGKYVLMELLNIPIITRVICLVRGKRSGRKCDAIHKLQRDIKNTKPEVEESLNKIEYVYGDITQSKFGIGEENWNELGVQVDAIFHCSGLVNHLERFMTTSNRKSSTDENVHSVNVIGLQNILELAFSGNKLKHLYHASSLHSFLMDGNIIKSYDNPLTSERWPTLDEILGARTTMAYPLSKMCQEILIKQAVERGLPCKAFRFPFLSGAGVDPRKSHVLQKYMFSMKEGIISDHPFPLILLPVEKCAKLSVELFLNEDCPSGPINITHFAPDLEQKFVNVTKDMFNINMSTVSFSEFVERLKKSESNVELTVFQELYQDKEVITGYVDNQLVASWVNGDCGDSLWKSKKISSFAPKFYEGLRSTMDYLCEDLQRILHNV